MPPLFPTSPLLLLLLFGISAAHALECSFCGKAKSLGDFKCPPITDASPTWDKDYVQYEAWKWAPIVYHHPLEKHYLTDPELWLSRAQQYGRTYKPVGAQEPTSAEMSWSFASVLNLSSAEEMMKGGGFDESGNSRARVWYNVLEHEETGGWIVNYNLFYGWNGCINMLLTTAKNGQDDSLEFYSCPTGIHEGDWERLSVLLCPGSPQIQAALFSQHNHHLLLNCSIGECEFETTEESDQPHLVTYSALHSHANYPHSHPNTAIFGQVRTFYGSADGLYLVDRLGRDTGHRFVPTRQNIALLPDSTRVRIKLDSDRKLIGVGGDKRVMKSGVVPGWSGADSWALYPGWWGARPEDTPQPPVIVCVMENQTLEGKCPDNDAYRLLRRIVGPLAMWDYKRRGGRGRGRQRYAQPSLDGTSLDASNDTDVVDVEASFQNVSNFLVDGTLPTPWLIAFDQLPPWSEVPDNYGIGRGPLFRDWTFAWIQPRDPGQWRMAESTLYMTTNHFSTVPSLVCPPAMKAGQNGSSTLDPKMYPWHPIYIIIAVVVGLFTLPLVAAVIRFVGESDDEDLMAHYDRGGTEDAETAAPLTRLVSMSELDLVSRSPRHLHLMQYQLLRYQHRHHHQEVGKGGSLCEPDCGNPMSVEGWGAVTGLARPTGWGAACVLSQALYIWGVGGTITLLKNLFGFPQEFMLVEVYCILLSVVLLLLDSLSATYGILLLVLPMQLQYQSSRQTAPGSTSLFASRTGTEPADGRVSLGSRMFRSLAAALSKPSSRGSTGGAYSAVASPGGGLGTAMSVASQAGPSQTPPLVTKRRNLNIVGDLEMQPTTSGTRYEVGEGSKSVGDEGCSSQPAASAASLQLPGRPFMHQQPSGELMLDKAPAPSIVQTAHPTHASMRPRLAATVNVGGDESGSVRGNSSRGADGGLVGGSGRMGGRGGEEPPFLDAESAHLPHLSQADRSGSLDPTGMGDCYAVSRLLLPFLCALSRFHRQVAPFLIILLGALAVAVMVAQTATIISCSAALPQEGMEPSSVDARAPLSAFDLANHHALVGVVNFFITVFSTSSCLAVQAAPCQWMLIGSALRILLQIDASCW